VRSESALGTLQLHHTEAGQAGSGQVGAVGRVGDQDHIALGVTPVPMICPDHERSRQLPLGACSRLQGDTLQTDYREKRLLQLP